MCLNKENVNLMHGQSEELIIFFKKEQETSNISKHYRLGPNILTTNLQADNSMQQQLLFWALFISG